MCVFLQGFIFIFIHEKGVSTKKKKEGQRNNEKKGGSRWACERELILDQCLSASFMCSLGFFFACSRYLYFVRIEKKKPSGKSRSICCRQTSEASRGAWGAWASFRQTRHMALRLGYQPLCVSAMILTWRAGINYAVFFQRGGAWLKSGYCVCGLSGDDIISYLHLSYPLSLCPSYFTDNII